MLVRVVDVTDELKFAFIDLKPSNILLELENAEEATTKYLSNTSPRLSSEPNRELDTSVSDAMGSPPVIPLREVVTTPLISEMERIHVRIIDFGVCMYSSFLTSQIMAVNNCSEWADLVSSILQHPG